MEFNFVCNEKIVRKIFMTVVKILEVRKKFSLLSQHFAKNFFSARKIESGNREFKFSN